MPDPGAARLRAKKAAYRVEHELYGLETRTVAEIKAELEAARRSIIATISTAQADWQIWQAKALLVEIERQLKAWTAVAANIAAGRLGDVADLGVEQALSALSAGRVGFAIGAGAMISRDFVAVAYQTMPMLISNISADVLRGVSTTLRQAVLAQRTPLDAMHEIGALVGRGIFPSAFLRGEVIVRTEYGRIAQTANYAVLSDLAREQKSLRKEWSAVLDFRTRESHALADGQTVEVDAEYNIGGHDALYPHDPQLPADESINCRCISVPYDESWGAAGHWADRRLEAAYDPNQPRVPAGSPTGGEWTAGESPLASGVYSASAAEYKIAFDAAFADNPRSAYVTHYTEAELQEMTLLLSNGGKTGQAIWDHGDGRIEATAVFNVSGIRGEGLRLLKEAVDDHGVNYLECFGPKLPEIYGTLGFKDTAVYPFDPAQAPKGWNYERDGTPDYHIMGLPK